MGCGGSKQTGASNQRADIKAEADRWERRKKNNFRDSGLERHRQNCIKQKKHLKHVADPDLKRTKDVEEKPPLTDKNKVAGKTGGLTENELLAKRAGLKHRS